LPYGLLRNTGKPQCCEDIFLFFTHQSCGKPALFVVVTKEVEHGMYGKKTDFTLQGMTIQLSLYHGTFHRYDNVTQHPCACLVV